MEIEKLRREYTYASLDRSDLDSDPFKQFKKWFDEAVKAKIDLPDMMTLSTAKKNGAVSARTVALRGFNEQGFMFFTNYESKKGKDIAENPQVALLFYWKELDRQVVIYGRAEKISPEESDTYFQSRSRESNLSALASQQGSAIKDHEELKRKIKQLEKKYQGKEIPRPSWWGGYRVIPNSIEFWQGRPNRLHDRFLYSHEDESWNIKRLSP